MTTDDLLLPVDGFALLHRFNPELIRLDDAPQPARPEPTRPQRFEPRPGITDCDPATRAHLRQAVGLTLDVLGGRRPETALAKLPLGTQTLAGLRTRLRTGKPTGMALVTLHTTTRAHGKVALFVGTWARGDKVRALAGRAERADAAPAAHVAWGGWVIVNLRFM